MRISVAKFIIFLLVLLGAFSCSSNVDIKSGLYTKTVEGEITADDSGLSEYPFVLVLNFHRTLMETSEGFLNRVSASIAYPDEEGRYSASFSSDTVKLQLMYYDYEKQVAFAEFSRSIGIGSYLYNITLAKDEDWRNSYYLNIKPVLIEYITEKRFQMNQMDRKFIGDWLSRADEKL